MFFEGFDHIFWCGDVNGTLYELFNGTAICSMRYLTIYFGSATLMGPVVNCFTVRRYVL